MQVRNKFAAFALGVAVLVVLAAAAHGYSVGKDMALRENAREAAMGKAQ